MLGLAVSCWEWHCLVQTTVVATAEVVVCVIVTVCAESPRSLDSLGLCLPLTGALASSLAPGPQHFQDFRSFWLHKGCQGTEGQESWTEPWALSLPRDPHPPVRGKHCSPGHTQDARVSGSGMSSRRQSGSTCPSWGSCGREGVLGTPSLLHVCPSSCPRCCVSLQTGSLVPNLADGRPVPREGRNLLKVTSY